MNSSIIDLMLKDFTQMGVTLTNIDVDTSSPTYYVKLNQTNLIQSVDDTLKSVEGILWVLTYGKLTNENRNNKINLKYQIVEGKRNEDN